MGGEDGGLGGGMIHAGPGGGLTAVITRRAVLTAASNTHYT